MSSNGLYGLRRDLSRGLGGGGLGGRLWDRTGVDSVDKSIIHDRRPAQIALIEQAKKEMDSRAETATNRFDTSNRLNLLSGLPPSSTTTNGSRPLTAKEKELERLRLDRQNQLAALTNPDLVCDPLLDERTDFTSYTIQQFKDELIKYSQGQVQEGVKARFAMTETKHDSSKSADLPPDLLLDDEIPELRPRQVLYWKSLDTVARVPIGVKCGVQNGETRVEAKNLAQTDINSQYYVRVVAFSFMRPNGTRQSSESNLGRTIMEIAIDSAKGNTPKWIILDKPNDHIYANFRLPDEEDKPIFEDMEKEVRFLHDRQRKLTEESLRLQAKLSSEISDLKEQMEAVVLKTTGRYGFTGAQNKLTDCILDNFDPVTGRWKDDGKFNTCLQETIKAGTVFQKVNEIRAKRLQNNVSDSGSWIDEKKGGRVPPIEIGSGLGIVPELTTDGGIQYRVLELPSTVAPQTTTAAQATINASVGGAQEAVPSQEEQPQGTIIINPE